MTDLHFNGGRMKRMSIMGMGLIAALMALLALGGTKKQARAQTSPKPSSRPSSTPATKSTTAPVTPPTHGAFAGLRFLIIGDSLSAYPSASAINGAPFGNSPGQLLAKKLTAAGATVQVNAIGGRNINGFMKGSTCATYGKKPKQWKVCEPDDGISQILAAIDEFHPDYILVMLGANDTAGIAVGNEVSYAIGAYKKLIAAVHAESVPLIGIGPPDFWSEFIYSSKYGTGPMQAANNKLVPAMKTAYGADHFIDCRAMTANIVTPAQGRLSDYIHFGSGGDKWATGIFTALLKMI